MNKFYRYLYVFNLVLFCFSCENKTHKTQKINIDTISIKIDDNYMHNYTSLKNIVYENNFYAFNKATYSIDIFDICENKVIKKINISKEGPNGINNIISFNVFSNTIVLENEIYYYMIDHRGMIIKKIKKENLEISKKYVGYDYLSKYQISIANYEDLVYDSKNGKIFFPIYHIEQENLYNKNFIATLDFNNENTDTIPIRYSALFKNTYFGKLSKPQFIIKGDSLIYNFGNSSKIFIYNTSNNNLIEKDIKSNYTNSISQSIETTFSVKEILDHFFHSIHFLGVQYDSYRNQFYRLHRNKSDDPSAFNNRETFLTILDANFDILEEIKLPINIYPFYNITAEGLIFQFLNGLEEDKFSYMILNSESISKVNCISYKINDDDPSINKTKVIPKEQNRLKQDAVFDVSLVESGKISEYIYKNMVYPESDYNNHKEGRVYIMLKSDDAGHIIDYKIMNEATAASDEMKKEALRIAQTIRRVNRNNISIFFHVNFSVEKYMKAKKHKTGHETDE